MNDQAKRLRKTSSGMARLRNGARMRSGETDATASRRTSSEISYSTLTTSPRSRNSTNSLCVRLLNEWQSNRIRIFAPVQQMRGNCSPDSQSTMRPPPKLVAICTKRWSSSTTWPMIAASWPSGWARMIASRCFGRLGRDEGDQLALVGDIERIEAEQFAGRRHLPLDRQRVFLDADADARLMGDLVQRRGQAAARRVAHQPQMLRRRRRPSPRPVRAARRNRTGSASRIAGSRGST